MRIKRKFVLLVVFLIGFDSNAAKVTEVKGDLVYFDEEKSKIETGSILQAIDMSTAIVGSIIKVEKISKGKGVGKIIKGKASKGMELFGVKNPAAFEKASKKPGQSCEDFRESNCPEGCISSCQPSGCSNDGICTTDCEGPGSCSSPTK